jgi:hypothetical protein
MATDSSTSLAEHIVNTGKRVEGHAVTITVTIIRVRIDLFWQNEAISPDVGSGPICAEAIDASVELAVLPWRQIAAMPWCMYDEGVAAASATTSMKRIRRAPTGEAEPATPYFMQIYWRPVGDSNPCSQRERLVS